MDLSNNRMGKNSMKSFSKEWEEIHRNQEWGKYPSEQLVRFIARNFYNKDRKNIKILDFGCGAGANTWFLAREGFDVYAFDGSESAVNRAKEYLNKDGYNNVHFSVMDGTELDYASDMFDCVVDNVCIYANKKVHIEIMYKEVYERLKKGGKLYSACFGEKTDGYGTGKYIEDNTYENIEKGPLEGRAIAHFFTKDELKETLEVSGFHNIIIDEMVYTDNGISIQMLTAKADK